MSLTSVHIYIFTPTERMATLVTVKARL